MQLPRLREWRQVQGLTQVELAEGANLSEYTVIRAEQGDSIRPNNARKLAEVLGVGVPDLVESPPTPLEIPAPLGKAPRETGPAKLAPPNPVEELRAEVARLRAENRALRSSVASFAESESGAEATVTEDVAEAAQNALEDAVEAAQDALRQVTREPSESGAEAKPAKQDEASPAERRSNA